MKKELRAKRIWDYVTIKGNNLRIEPKHTKVLLNSTEVCYKKDCNNIADLNINTLTSKLVDKKLVSVTKRRNICVHCYMNKRKNLKKHNENYKKTKSYKKKYKQNYSKQIEIGKKRKKRLDACCVVMLQGLVPNIAKHIEFREEQARYVILDLFLKSNINFINEYIVDVETKTIMRTRNVYKKIKGKMIKRKIKEKHTFRQSVAIDIYIPSLDLYIEAKRNSGTCTSLGLHEQIEKYEKAILKNKLKGEIDIYSVLGNDINKFENAEKSLLQMHEDLYFRVLNCNKIPQINKAIFFELCERNIAILQENTKKVMKMLKAE